MSDPPLAYFLTWTTYGTWLRGDERGWIERRGKRPLRSSIDADPQRDLARLTHPAVRLSQPQRQIVDQTIRQVSEHRGWLLLALNVRSNHVHAVIRAEQSPERVMTSLKSWSTRRLREQDSIQLSSRIWTRHGSTRWITADADLRAAIDYVSRLQDAPR